MSTTTYVYFGDNIFHKLNSLIGVDTSWFSLKCVKSKIFSTVNILSNVLIDEVYVGWSYFVLQVGDKFYHVGYPNSKGDVIEVFKAEHAKILNVSCSANKIYAVTYNGKIFSYSTEEVQPTRLDFNDEEMQIERLVAGDLHTVAIIKGGNVSVLNLEQHTSIPLHLPSAIAEVACGKEHVIFLSKSGQVFSYGYGSRGQLGHGSIENQNCPLLLEALDGIQIKAIACGGWHSCAISYAGDLYVWGWNESGQLGFPCAELHGDTLPLNEIETVCCLPKIVEFEEEKHITSISCGSRHTAILTEDFEVWSWGWNEYGQLGHDKYPLCDKPVKISFCHNFVPKKIKCAFWSTLVWGTITV